MPASPTHIDWKKFWLRECSLITIALLVFYLLRSGYLHPYYLVPLTTTRLVGLLVVILAMTAANIHAAMPGQTPKRP